MESFDEENRGGDVTMQPIICGSFEEPLEHKNMMDETMPRSSEEQE